MNDHFSWRVYNMSLIHCHKQLEDTKSFTWQVSAVIWSCMIWIISIRVDIYLMTGVSGGCCVLNTEYGEIFLSLLLDIVINNMDNNPDLQ